MTVRLALALLVCDPSLWAQAAQGRAPEHDVRPGAISGHIRDIESGQDISRTLLASAESNGRRVSQIEASGTYSFQELPPGQYELRLAEEGYPLLVGVRTVTVISDTKSSDVDIYVHLNGSLEGVVLDEGREPVNGAIVVLVTMEYHFGRMAFSWEQYQKTDDRGVYRFLHLRSAHSYLLLVLPPRAAAVSAGSGLAAEWYPSPPAGSEPAALVLRSGEAKQIEMRLRRSATHCMSGTLSAEGHPGVIDFELAIREIGEYSMMTGVRPGPWLVSSGKSSANGSFRVCGLWPGEFRLSVIQKPLHYAYKVVSVDNRDIDDIKLDARPPLSVTGDVQWDRPSGSDSLMATAAGRPRTVSFRLIPVDRPQFDTDEIRRVAEAQVPGSFRAVVPAMTEYRVEARNLGDFYLKYVRLEGGPPLLNRTIGCGEGSCTVHITVGTDTGNITYTVHDDSGKPVPRVPVCMVPEKVLDEGQMSDLMKCGETDPDYGTGVVWLPPGRYYAVIDEGREETASSIADLWERRTSAPVVDVMPDSSVHVELQVPRHQ